MGHPQANGALDPKWVKPSSKRIIARLVLSTGKRVTWPKMGFCRQIGYCVAMQHIVALRQLTFICVEYYGTKMRPIFDMAFKSILSGL
jgi:hypothetical protein